MVHNRQGHKTERTNTPTPELPSFWIGLLENLDFSFPVHYFMHIICSFFERPNRLNFFQHNTDHLTNLVPLSTAVETRQLGVSKRWWWIPYFCHVFGWCQYTKTHCPAAPLPRCPRPHPIEIVPIRYSPLPAFRTISA